MVSSTVCSPSCRLVCLVSGCGIWCGGHQKRAIALQQEKEREKAAAAQAKQRKMALEQVEAFKKAAELKAKQVEEDAAEEERLAAYAREQARKER